MNWILAILQFFNWDNFRDFLAKHTYIGVTASAGTSVVTIVYAVNPFLQLVGLIAGLAVAFLTIEAKLEERKERRKKLKS